MPEPTVYDGFTMNADGTVTVNLDDGPRRLRRPKIGELRRLREARQRGIDEVQQIGQALRLGIASVRERAAERDPDSDDNRRILSPDERAEMGKLTVEAEEGQAALVLAWLRLAFDGGDVDGHHLAGLSDKTLPGEDDDLPGWFMDLTWTAPKQLLDHWTYAPPPRGPAA